jgi:Ca2+-binding RTX toxin-like protein
MNDFALRAVLRVLRMGAVVAAAVAAVAGALPIGEAGAAAARTGVTAVVQFGTLKVTGTSAGEKIALRLKSGNSAIIEVDAGDDGTADFSFNRADVHKIAVNAGPGDDAVRIDEVNGVFTTSIPTAIDGGEGNDNLTGGSGNELFLGGPGNDSVDGKRGNDAAGLGAGDDSFVWDPGDGSDAVEGGPGSDTEVFNGANVAEHFRLNPVSNPLAAGFLLLRDVGNITMANSGIEQLDLTARGGADIVDVGNLAGTGLKKANIDLGGADAAVDTVNVVGTNAADVVTISGGAGSVSETGLATALSITGAEPANDRLAVDLGGGDDALDASKLAATSVKLSAHGGEGNDVLVGSAGDDSLFGDAGDDILNGGPGNDVLDGGTGSNVLIQ